MSKRPVGMMTTAKQYSLVQFSDTVIVLREPGNRVERFDPDWSTMAEGDTVVGRMIHYIVGMSMSELKLRLRQEAEAQCFERTNVTD
jgi:hypothetical protein